MTAPARRAAQRALRDVHLGRAILGDALAVARQPLDDPRDRGLAGEIVTGTLRWQAALDHRLAQVTDRPLQRVDGDVLDILRTGAYQLLHLTRMPHHAVVNDAVALTRAAGKRSAAGFVNAVLRAMAARGATLRLPSSPETTPDAWNEADRTAALDYLSITLSHPRWLAERWLQRLGFDTACRWARFDNEPAPVTLRVNRRRVDREEVAARLRKAGIETTPGLWAPDALHATSGNPLATSLAREGLIITQSEASQLVGGLIRATPGDRVLDLCAAPGGKTLAIADALADDGLIVASDRRARRITRLSATLRRHGVSCADPIRLDATRSLPFPAVFDWVLVDAPCSGLGTLARDPDIRWRRQPDDLADLAATQATMLRAASEVVRPGGRLVYATCSSEPDENTDVVEDFLETNPAYAIESPPDTLDAALFNARGHLETTPHQHDLEGFFGATFRRTIA
jgi:16S rRNA (cytosine967-C5)-methyltransferase